MSPAERLLLSVTSAQWVEMTGEQRAVVFDAIHEVVPGRLLLASVVGHEPQPFPFFIDQETQFGCYLVFGQRFVMGATEAAIQLEVQVRERASYDDEWADHGAADGWYVAPEHEVDVAPFFAGESELSDPLWVKLGVTRKPGLPLPANALAALAPRGLRLPAEAELELLRILAGHSGLVRLDSGLCADDWHRDYNGAPPRGLPWGSSNGLRRVHDVWRGPGTMVVREPAKDLKHVRPFSSLFPEAVGYCDEAVAARAAEPALRSKR
ncbi:MAG: hypothetical protein QM723_13420 [Myxococcaceae bacterium]